MADYKGHTIGGFVAGTAYVVAVSALPGDITSKTGHVLSDWQFLAGLLIIAMLFALWPDVDTNSMGQNFFFGIAFIADVLLILTGHFEAAAYLGLLAMTPIIGHHRGWTHSRWAMVLVPSPIIIVPYIHNHKVWIVGLLIYGAALAGYFSHLLLDGLITRHIAIRSKRHY